MCEILLLKAFLVNNPLIIFKVLSGSLCLGTCEILVRGRRAVLIRRLRGSTVLPTFVRLWAAVRKRKVTARRRVSSEKLQLSAEYRAPSAQLQTWKGRNIDISHSIRWQCQIKHISEYYTCLTEHPALSAELPTCNLCEKYRICWSDKSNTIKWDTIFRCIWQPVDKARAG